MTTLTADQIAWVRTVTGARDENVISDDQIQTAYDEAVANALDSSLVNAYTYTYILRGLVGYYAYLVDQTTDHGDQERLSQRWEHYRDLLEDWESKAGLSSEVLDGLSVNIINLGIDATSGDSGTQWA